MSAKVRMIRDGTAHGSALWPVLLALLVVLIPTACVLWFLNEAVQNERLAAKQKLAEAYRGYLPKLRDRLQSYWQQQAEALDSAAAKSAGPAAFAACVRQGLADSVVCYDASGQLSYPAPATGAFSNSPLPRVGEGLRLGALEQPADNADWKAAQQLEYAGNDPAAAAAAYDEIARTTTDDRLAALALQAEARCLARAGRVVEAVHVLADTLADERYSQVLSPDRRLIAADAQLRALELIGDSSRPGFAPLADRLAKWLNDYAAPLLPAAQRRFLMKELRRLTDGLAAFPTLQAEELAAAYLETNPLRADGALRLSELSDVWRFTSPSGRIVALLRTETLLKRTAGLIAADEPPGEVRVAVTPPDTEAAENIARLLPAGSKMPGWRLTLAFVDSARTEAGADQRIVAYVWIAVLVIAAMSIVAALVAGRWAGKCG